MGGACEAKCASVIWHRVSALASAQLYFLNTSLPIYSEDRIRYLAMDIKYEQMILYKNVKFYVAPGGHQAYFFCGGSLIAMERPVYGSTCVAEFAKFGLVLGGGECKPLAAYIRRELSRRGMKWALPSEGEDIFVDCLAMLSRDGICSERELCGDLSLETYDPAITNYIVSESGVSGLLLCMADDSSEENTIHLSETPTVTDLHTDCTYDCNRNVFTLAYARLTELPNSLHYLVEGLFDGIPVPRLPLSPNTRKTRIDIVITAKTAAKTTAVKCTSWQRDRSQNGMALNGNSTQHALKKTRFCTFVQVKYIPRTIRIWARESSQSRSPPPLNKLWELFCTIDLVFRNESRMIAGMEVAMGALVDEVAIISDVLFGRHAPVFIGHGSGYKTVSPTQKFLLLQYVNKLNGMPNCFGLLSEICHQYQPGVEKESPQSMLDSVLVDMVNSMYKTAVFVGIAAEVVGAWMPASPDELEMQSPSAVAFGDSTVLLDITDNTAVSDDTRKIKVHKLALILDQIYRGADIVATAWKESSYMDTSNLLCAAIDVSLLTAFEKSEGYSEYMRHIISLIDVRLKDAGCDTICL
uniref:UL21 tegument protein n=1 Tax=Meleagrid herpesvirus 1 TaxID=37108 RepID=Q9E1H1_MEHV1|nr:UL21 tegument protein [Meleagrid alphaherpesvirus 1]